MPNRKTHERVGMVTGMVAASVFVPEQPGWYSAASILGGLLGGKGGGLLPDRLDLPTSPNHRGPAHGVLPVGTVLKALGQGYLSLFTQLVELAELEPADRNGSINWDKVLYLFLAGLMAGFAAGYGSHLLLDLGTPMGLPAW